MVVYVSDEFELYIFRPLMANKSEFVNDYLAFVLSALFPDKVEKWRN